MAITAERKKKESGLKHEEGNLVCLVWPLNTCYIHLQKKIPEGVELNLREGTWSFRGETFPIGKTARGRFLEDEGTPLGIYDRMNDKHLEEMLEAAYWVATRFSRISLDE